IYGFHSLPRSRRTPLRQNDDVQAISSARLYPSNDDSPHYLLTLSGYNPKYKKRRQKMILRRRIIAVTSRLQSRPQIPVRSNYHQFGGFERRSPEEILVGCQVHEETGRQIHSGLIEYIILQRTSRCTRLYLHYLSVAGVHGRSTNEPDTVIRNDHTGTVAVFFENIGLVVLYIIECRRKSLFNTVAVIHSGFGTERTCNPPAVGAYLILACP